MVSERDCGLMLRFRDLVTEPGGNVSEHRKIIRRFGYAWWGWWARKQESVPNAVLSQLFPKESASVNVLLYDSGLMKLFRTKASGVVVAPSHLGVTSPDFEATPEYYVRGRYPAWFKFFGDIVPFEGASPTIVRRPSLVGSDDKVNSDADAEIANLDVLHNDRATLWLVTLPE